MSLQMITGSIINSRAACLHDSDGETCNRLQINGIDNKIYLIATKTIPSTFAEKLYHWVSWGDSRYTELTYLDSATKKTITILVNKNSLLKRLHRAGTSKELINKALEPSVCKNGEELSNFISENFLQALKQKSIANQFATRNNPLSSKERTEIFQYWVKNKDDLINRAKTNSGSIRIRPSESGLSRTLLVTHEDGVTKAFVIFNRMKTQNDKSIGSGGFKTKINLCFELTEGKWATHTSFSDEKKFLEEVDVLKQYRNIPNILQLLATDEYKSHKTDETKYSMITELCTEGEAFEEIFNSNFNSKFPPGKLKHACKELAIALQEVHKTRRIHRDIKPENIFITKVGDEYKLVLADFGISYEIGTSAGEKLTGTPPYFHPKIAYFICNHIDQIPNDNQIHQPIDVWALGVVFYIMKYEDTPNWFNEDDRNQVFKKLAEYHTDPTKEVFPKPSDTTSFEYLIWNMLQADPAKQWTLEQVIAFLETSP
ncbi:MAG: serine/threonine-protein kinase [Chlamydiae bacterium]|nr:serine/threonine-protein kinase [Chlamydiota bacterium]